jgi:hypothetical protein
MNGNKFFIHHDCTAIIVDYVFYAENERTIDYWCADILGYNPRVGMVLRFNNSSELELFLLRWT